MKREILLVAYAADPNVSSDGVAGWGFLKAALASIEIVRVHLLSSEHSILSCKNALSEEENQKVIYHLVAPSKLFSKFKTSPFGIKARFAYIDWIFQSRRYLKTKEIDFSKIQIVHHVTLATEIYPTVLSAIPGKCTKIIGPVGSSGNFRILFSKPRNRLTLQETLKQILRNAISKYRLKKIALQVDLFIGNNKLSTTYVQKLGKCKSIYFSNHIVPNEISELPPWKNEKYDVLIVGQIVPGKRPDLAIDYLSRKEFQSLSIAILGEGQAGFKRKLENLIARKDMISRVTFLGNLPRHYVLSLMQHAKFLIHFSGREGSSYVVGEAINMGLPILCLDGTGAADTLSSFPQAGVSLKVENLNQLKPMRILEELKKSRNKATNYWTYARITHFLDHIYNIDFDKEK